MNEIQTVPAVRSEDGRSLIVTCPGCNSTHTHGRHDSSTGCAATVYPSSPPCTCPTGTGDGHRVAHCQQVDGGYVLREVGDGYGTTTEDRRLNHAHLLRLGWDDAYARKVLIVAENRYRGLLTWAEIRLAMARQVLDGEGPQCGGHNESAMQYAREYLAKHGESDQ